ncbi:MAG: glycosyltransferase [Deltaproteobacteria bacterium]|nr:glycosyltransferase [Deltaproteobacteria bacterium]
MKIIHTITRLEGGPGVTTPVLVEEMSRLGHDVSLLYGSSDIYDPSGRSDHKKSMDLKSFFIPAMKRNISLKKDTRALIEIVRVFLKERPDVVHTHESKDGTLARVAAKLCRVPVVLRSYHGLVYYDNYFGKKTSVVKPAIIGIEKVLNILTDRVISLSDSLTDEIVDEFALCPRTKITVIPNYYKLDNFIKLNKSSFLNKELNIRDGARIITVVANFQPPKEHVTILKSFNLVLKEKGFEDAHLVLVGEGPLRGLIEENIKEMKLGNRVHLLGFRNDIPDILSSTDLFLMGSKSEGTPGAMIQALAAGCRVVGTIVGGIPDLLENGKYGSMSVFGDPDALRNAIVSEFEIIRDHDVIRKSIEEKYGVSNVAARFLALYESILMGKL